MDLRDKAVRDELYGCEEIAVDCVCGDDIGYGVLEPWAFGALPRYDITEEMLRMTEHQVVMTDEVSRLANAARVSNAPQEVAERVRGSSRRHGLCSTAIRGQGRTP